MRYQFQIKHIPGKLNLCADAASRYPVQSENETSNTHGSSETSSICSSLFHASEVAPEKETDTELSVTYETMALLSDSPQLKAVTWNRIRAAAREDKVCCDLVKIISSGFPAHKRDLPEHLRPFWSMRFDLYSVDGVPINNRRLLVPQLLRREVLECLHSAHQGVTGMREHAKHRLFWPGLDAALCLTRAQCADCNNKAPSQSAEPLLEVETPEFPFQSTATDLFHCQGHKFLIYVDRFSAWLEIALTPRSDALTVIGNLRHWFTTFGVPMDIASDGGPPFDSTTYIAFLKTWGISRRLSSAYFPRSNGRAELGVKSGKRLLMANLDSTGSINKDAISRALLTYRNTPLQDCSISPAELLYGRKLRDHLPTLPTEHSDVLPKWKELRQAREIIFSTRVTERAEKSQLTRVPLQPLAAGQHVLIQNGGGVTPTRWNRSGIVVEVLPFRQYRVKYDGSGRLQVRNRQHLKAFVPPTSIPAYPAVPSLTIPDVDTTPRPPVPAHESTPIRPDQVTTGRPRSPSWPTSLPLNSPHTTAAYRDAPNTAPPSDRNSTIVNDHTTHLPNESLHTVPCQELSTTIPYDLSEPLLRRGTRARLPPVRLSPKLSGKTHLRN